MSYGGGFGASGSRSQGFNSDDLYKQEPTFPSQRRSHEGDSFDYDGGFVGSSRSLDAGFAGGGREVGFDAASMGSGPFLGSKLMPPSARQSSSLRYFDPPEPRYSDRDSGRFSGDHWHSRDRPIESSSDSFRGGRVDRGRGFGARGGGSSRKSHSQYSDRREPPRPTSDAQKSGSGTIWYAGPRCSLIKDAESGDQVFMYNSAMQPQDTKVTENMEVLYGAFYDKKFIKKHQLTTLWEAAWVEVYEDEADSSGAKRRRSRSPIDTRKPNRVRSPNTATTSSATNKSPARKMVQKKIAAEAKETPSSKEPTNADDDEAAHEDSEDDDATEKNAEDDDDEAEYSE